MPTETPDVEAVILTGGASRRMGMDKSELTVDGVSLVGHIVSELSSRSIPITVLGKKAVDLCRHIPDDHEFQGPLLALSRFTPTRPFCFVASCDMPGFDGALIGVLRSSIHGHDAVIPSVDGRLQPLCALYAAHAWTSMRALVDSDERRIMKWVASLSIETADEEALAEAGIHADACSNVNTKEELNEFLQRRSAG